MSHTVAVYEDLTITLPVEVTVLGGEAQEAAEAAAFDKECRRVHGVPFAEFEATCDAARAAIVAERKKKEPDAAVIEAAEKAIETALALTAPPAPPAPPADKE